MSDPRTTVAFQGAPGAYSHLAVCEVLPDRTPLACGTFDDAFAALTEGRADRAVIPIENSLAGRVADIHHLLPGSGLSIVGEHFHRVRHQLLAPRGASLSGLKVVHSHAMALAQCRNIIRGHGLTAVIHADTAGAAADVALWNDPAIGAIAPAPPDPH